MNLQKLIRRSVLVQQVPFYLLAGVCIYAFVSITIEAESISLQEVVSMILAMAFGAGGAYWMFRKKLKPTKYWMDLIENKPTDLVWLKPVEIKHKLLHVATVAKSTQFELFSKDGCVVIIDTSMMHRGMAIKEFKELLPDIHFGYSKEVKKIFRRHKEDFIGELKRKNLYCPLSDYEL